MSHTEKPLPDPLFIADHRAIDFLNTVATPGPEILDWLRDGASFMSWLRRGFTVPDDLKVPPANLERLAAEARELREWFRGFVEKHAGRPLKPSVAAGLRPLNELLQRGQIHIQYGDGCTLEFAAPQAVAIEPGHDGWVVGSEPAVMIEFDFEGDTVERLGMPGEHSH